MRTRVVLSLLIVAASVFLLIIVVRPRPRTEIATPEGDEAKPGTQAVLDSRPVTRPRQFPEADELPGEPKWLLEPMPPGTNLQEHLQELARQKGVSVNTLTQLAIATLSNALAGQLSGSIEFYGKAVDERGAPLQGASAAISCIIFPEAEFTTNLVTDAKGLFALRGIAGRALIASVTKQGYEEIPGTNQNLFAYYGVANGFQPLSNSPVGFRLREKRK